MSLCSDRVVGPRRGRTLRRFIAGQKTRPDGVASVRWQPRIVVHLDNIDSSRPARECHSETPQPWRAFKRLEGEPERRDGEPVPGVDVEVVDDARWTWGAAAWAQS